MHDFDFSLNTVGMAVSSCPNTFDLLIISCILYKVWPFLFCKVISMLRSGKK